MLPAAYGRIPDQPGDVRAGGGDDRCPGFFQDGAADADQQAETVHHCRGPEETGTDYQQGTASLPRGKARLRQRYGNSVAADRVHHRAKGDHGRVLPDGPEMGHPPAAAGSGDVHRLLLLPDCVQSGGRGRPSLLLPG